MRKKGGVSQPNRQTNHTDTTASKMHSKIGKKKKKKEKKKSAPSPSIGHVEGRHRWRRRFFVLWKQFQAKLFASRSSEGRQLHGRPTEQTHTDTHTHTHIELSAVDVKTNKKMQDTSACLVTTASKPTTVPNRNPRKWKLNTMRETTHKHTQKAKQVRRKSN